MVMASDDFMPTLTRLSVVGAAGALVLLAGSSECADRTSSGAPPMALKFSEPIVDRYIGQDNEEKNLLSIQKHLYHATDVPRRNIYGNHMLNVSYLVQFFLSEFSP